MFNGLFSGGVIKKALDKGLLAVKVHDLRDYAHDKHRQVDDRPFGGQEGMVLKPEPIFEAVEAVRAHPRAYVCLLSPQGRKLDSRLAEEMAGHGYHLQYLLYTLALRRYLALRLPDFDYERDFGGVFYLFVRGVRPGWKTPEGQPTGVYFHRPQEAAMDSLEALIAGKRKKR